MSKCMTIDEAIDQKDTLEVTPKDIVGSVLEEILVSVLTVPDKGCNRIGDFNINEDFCQQYNQPLPVKDFEQVNINQTSATEYLYSDKSKGCSITGNDILEAGWCGETEERFKFSEECKVISDEIQAGNELQIQNGQIHLEKIKSSLELAREEYYRKEDVIKDEKIEIEYYDEGKVNKIYVPLNDTPKELKADSHNDIQNKEEAGKENLTNESKSSFKPFTTEELRQVWDSGNLSLLGKWDGDVANQREEIVKLLEGLSNIQVYPDGSVDPNRPRTCSVAEEDVKKMIKEIEEINFNQGQDAVEDYPPDGQGDADLESKSFTKSKDILNKPRTESKLLPERSSDEIKRLQEKEMEIRQDLPLESDPYLVKEPSAISMPQTVPPFQTSEISQEGCFENNVSKEEIRPEINQQSETSAAERQVAAEKFILDDTLKNTAGMEDIKDVFSMTGSVDLFESRDRILSRQEETVQSISISGNDILSEFTVSLDSGAAKLATSSITKASVSSKQQSLAELEKMQNGSGQVIKTPSDGKGKFISSDIYPENVDEDGQRPFETKLNEDTLQGNSSCSQSFKSNGESEAQSKKSGSLQSQESLSSSDSQTQEDNSVKSESGKFNLHSKKMYSRMGYDSANAQNKKRILSDSEEALIESTESVLQIIEPEDNDQEERSSSTVLFSLMPQATNEALEKSSVPREEGYESDKDENAEDPSSEIPREKVYSGMTTIGPMKNTDYDPKDLTAPDIDFGKMKQITSTRQLAKEFNLMRGELSGATTVKILEEIDSDESVTENENFCMETVSLINRDIASLTKVQKVREVMSYQPNLEKDFEDDEGFPKHRLDLKDVESVTDERYKVPDVGLPVLSVAVTSELIETDPEAEKQLIERMGLIINGLTEPYFDNEEENDESSNQLIENLEEKLENSEAVEEALPKSQLEEEKSQKDIDIPVNFPDAVKETESKYKTLSGVIKKGSNRFMKKDSDMLLRNSKSLPRDSSKIIPTETIRSILDDCSTSASNVLKRSQCMLRNTQSLFKTISQNRMGNDNTLEKHKISPSESDISTVERKLSFLKKEDFAKAKNLIKSKMEKTFKRQESSSEIKVEREEDSDEKKDLQVVIRNEEKLRVDRMENFKRWLPKSPLVYKSQFVKSQIKLKDNSQEADTGSKKEDENDVNVESQLTTTANEETVTVKEIPNETEETPQQELNEEAIIEYTNEEDVNEVKIKEETQPDYIVMETIEGLPISDLDSPSSEKENMGANEPSIEYGKDYMNKVEAQAMNETDLGIVLEHVEIEEDKATPKISPQENIVGKKKKLSTRLRNFWCTAFGRVKTPPKKSDIS